MQYGLSSLLELAIKMVAYIHRDSRLATGKSLIKRHYDCPTVEQQPRTAAAHFLALGWRVQSAAYPARFMLREACQVRVTNVAGLWLKL